MVELTEDRILDIIATTFKHRERKIMDMAARHAYSRLCDDLMRTGMALRVPRPKPIKPDWTLANALVAHG